MENNKVKVNIPGYKKEVLISTYRLDAQATQFTVLFNNSGRTVSYNNSVGFTLSGAYAPYFVSLMNTFSGGVIDYDGVAGMTNGTINFRMDEPAVFIFDASAGNAGRPLYIKFDIYE